MSPMYGLEICPELQKKASKYKSKPKFGFITTFCPYREWLKEEYPELKVDCFIFVPMPIDELVKTIEKA